MSMDILDGSLSVLQTVHHLGFQIVTITALSECKQVSPVWMQWLIHDLLYSALTLIASFQLRSTLDPDDTMLYLSTENF